MRVIISLLLIALLSGCVFAPGMKMRSVPLAVQLGGTSNPPKLTFIPIDVKLVQRFQRTGMDTQDDAYYYHISPHDILNIHVWGHPELAGPTGQVASETGNNANPTINPAGYLVGPDGDIYFPLVGRVHVAGQTVQEGRLKLTALLKKYIRNPQLDIRVIGFRSKKVYVMGEVMKPAMIPITDAPISLTDAINLVGGMDPNVADPSHVFVIRGDYAAPEIYWLDAASPDALLLGESFLLKNHDVVFVSTAPVARWNRAINQILPSIQTVWFTYSIVKSK